MPAALSRNALSPRRRGTIVRAAAAPLLAGSLLLAGCGGGGGNSNANAYINQPGWTINRSQPVYNKKTWTFLVYLNGANNLDPDGVTNIGQMASVGSNDSVNIVVQWKRLSGWNGETRRFYITQNNSTDAVAAAPLSTQPSLDMGKAQSLQDFVQWGAHAFPAQHYCLVLWDHGAGWRAQKVATGSTSTRATAATATTTPLRRGFSYDDLTKSHIDTTELPGAISLGGGFKWDLLAMDASLMQMAEVDYEMRDQVSYIVASEESPSELGYPYNTMLTDLESNPGWDGVTFGIDIAKKTYAYYTANSDVTQSVIDASQLSALAPAVNALGSALTAAQGTYGTQIATARSDAESVDSGDYAGYYRDLSDFVHLLTDSGTGLTPVADSDVQSAAQGVKNVLAKAIVYNAHGKEHPSMNGLTIFLPTPARYATVEAEQASAEGPGGGSLLYTSLSFVKAAPNWNSFLANGPQ